MSHRCEDTMIWSWLEEHTVPFCNSLWKVCGSSLILAGIQSWMDWNPICSVQESTRTTAKVDLIPPYHAGPCQT